MGACMIQELQRTPHSGTHYSRAVRGLMMAEDHWADWKLGGAHTFERPPAVLETPGAPPAKRRRQSRNNYMGTRNLTK